MKKQLDETTLILLTTLLSIVYFGLMKLMTLDPLTTTSYIIMGTLSLLYALWMAVALDMAIETGKK